MVVTPGTGVVYTPAAGLSRGGRASAAAAVGCTLGIVPHMLAAATGLATLLHTSAVAFQTLTYLGVAFMLLTFVVFSAYGIFAEAVRESAVLAPGSDAVVTARLRRLLRRPGCPPGRDLR